MILGSSASLKSSSYPRVWRDLKKIECEDLIAGSSSKTRILRSAGLSVEKAMQMSGISDTIRATKIESFAIVSRVLGTQIESKLKHEGLLTRLLKS